MFQTAVVVLFAALAAASADATLRPWTPAGPEDSRGPCPMLNTLANHGYLPHDGRNLTLHHFAEAVVSALNVAERYGTVPAQQFITGTGKTYFDLEDLNTPGVLQHIASLTRDDVTPDESHIKLAPHRLEALLADSATEYVTADSIGKSRLRVEALSKPNKLTTKELLISYVEAGLVLMMMNEEPVPSALTFPSATVWAAPKDRVRTWLAEERLPNELGWKRSERQISTLDLIPVMKAVYDMKRLHSGEPAFGWSWLSSDYFALGEL